VSDAVVREGRVLRLRVARGRHGTLDGDALPLIAEALNSADPAEVGAALVVSEGASFCTGGDVKAFAAAEDRGAYVGDLAEAFHGMVTAFATCAVPVVAAVPGLGGGRGDVVVCAVDIAVAGPLHPAAPAYPASGSRRTAA
jgi:2-(1,2-epoxy-1,2-dihydrophenyl)acetyl-CoA isomerase